MELIDVIQQINQQSQRASAPTDLVTGTVVKADPLEISINAQMEPIKEQIIYLTGAVIEKKIPILEHTHQAAGGATGQAQEHTHPLKDGGRTELGGAHSHSLPGGKSGAALKREEIFCLENGEKLPVEDGYIILNRGLREKDKVLMLRVQHGQRFVVLSRIFEKQAGDDYAGNAGEQY